MALNRNVVQLRSMILVNLTVYILVLAVLISSSTSFQEIPFKKKHNIHFPIENVSSSCHDFTSLFYKNLLHGNDNENIATSPVNLYTSLFVLAYGASGSTLDELRSVLHHKDIVSLKKEFEVLLFLLNNMDFEDITLYTRNKILLKDGYQYSLEFIFMCLGKFNTLIQHLSESHYTQSNADNFRIKNTKISHVIFSDDINNNTTMALLSPIYFKAKWFQQFDIRYTHRSIFYASKTEKYITQIMFMYAKLNYGTIPQWEASFIEIPYTNPDFVMVILLPNKEVELRTVENRFNWRTLANTPRSMEVIDLYLPKFSIKSTTNLKTVLNKIGLNAMFSIDDADFTRISENSLHIDSLLQSIFFEINEDGSEDFTAKAPRRMRFRAQLPTLFMVNRPFLFAIEYKPNNIPIFLGSVRKITDKISDKPIKIEL